MNRETRDLRLMQPAGERRGAPRLTLVRTPPTPHVLVVLRLDRPRSSWRALARGRRIARARGARLSYAVLRPRPGPVDAMIRPAPAGPLRRVLGFAATLLARFGALVTDRIIVQRGHPTRLVTEIVDEIAATLVVVGEEPGAGGHWARVVRRTNVPVLVARRRCEGSEIVAGTDFTDRRFPTFAAAVSMAENGNRRVLILHNVDPEGVAFTRRQGLVLSDAAMRKLRDARAEQLHDLAKIAGVEAHAVLTANHEPTTAVREHARRLDADLVIVGAHASSRLQRRRRRTANKLIEGLDRSVLVLPLAQPSIGV